MSATLKEYNNYEMNLSINIHIDGKQNVWFKGKDIASALGYKDTYCAIRKHVDEEYKRPGPYFIRGRSVVVFF